MHLMQLKLNSQDLRMIHLDFNQTTSVLKDNSIDSMKKEFNYSDREMLNSKETEN
jgi:hypothetical protein